MKRALAALLLLVAAACKAKEAGPAAPVVDAAAPPAPPAPPEPDPKAAFVPEAPSAPPAVPAATFAPSAEGGGGCAILAGPLEQAYRGAGALYATGDGVDVVFNDSGAARVTHVANAPSPARVQAEKPPGAASSLACAVAGDAVFCPDASGGVHRASRAGGRDAVVAHALRGTPIGAVVVGGKSLVAFLVRKKTDEETRTTVEAFVDRPPNVVLSAEGATSFALAPVAGGAILVTVDARSALTSVRAVPLTPGDPVQIGDGAVVFVGGPPAGTELAAEIATSSSGARLALLPMSKDFSTFGMAAIAIHDPPRADEAVTWSEYPNGMARAPLAATRGAARALVARVRPAASASASPKVLELGRVDDAGAFTSYGFVETRGEPTDVAVAEGAGGSAWVLYSDGEGSWLERRRCP